MGRIEEGVRGWGQGLVMAIIVNIKQLRTANADNLEILRPPLSTTTLTLLPRRPYEFILTGSQVMQVLDMDLALTSVEEAFRAYGEGRVNMPPKAYLTLARGTSGPCTARFFCPGTTSAG